MDLFLTLLLNVVINAAYFNAPTGTMPGDAMQTGIQQAFRPYTEISADETHAKTHKVKSVKESSYNFADQRYDLKKETFYNNDGSREKIVDHENYVGSANLSWTKDANGYILYAAVQKQDTLSKIVYAYTSRGDLHEMRVYNIQVPGQFITYKYTYTEDGKLTWITTESNAGKVLEYVQYLYPDSIIHHNEIRMLSAKKVIRQRYIGSCDSIYTKTRPDIRKKYFCKRTEHTSNGNRIEIYEDKISNNKVKRTFKEYNAAGLLISEQENEGITELKRVAYTYDQAGHLTEENTYLRQKLDVRKVYQYEKDLLQQTVSYDDKGKVLSRRKFEYELF